MKSSTANSFQEENVMNVKYFDDDFEDEKNEY